MHVPFVSFEATAFTSVGFVGADVRDIIKELYKCAVKIVNEDAEKAEKDALRRENMMKVLKLLNLAPTEKNIANYESGIWDDIRADENHSIKEIRLQEIATAIDFQISKADEAAVTKKAVELCETGIIFIDEIDKICIPKGSIIQSSKGDVNTTGVQRDLLPLLDGALIPLDLKDKHQLNVRINTKNILFISAGAFYHTKVTDLIPELQGRFSTRVKLHPLNEQSLYEVLSKAKFGIIRQQIELFKQENTELIFTDESLRRIAYYANQLNTHLENVGARRLRQLVDIVLDEHSFELPENWKPKITIEAAYVNERLDKLLKSPTKLTNFVI